ncbi:hypothetical protein OV142_46590 [Nannocystis sp. SCPEA4]|nr:hypothetical protein [Nannocystis sp. SCPEA4]
MPKSITKGRWIEGQPSGTGMVHPVIGTMLGMTCARMDARGIDQE